MSRTTKYIIAGICIGAVLGAFCFGSIAAVVPGGWGILESAVIGFWVGAACGFGVGMASA